MIGWSMRAVILASLTWLPLCGAAVSALATGANENGAAAQLKDGAGDAATIYVKSLIEEAVPRVLATPSPQRPQELRRLLEENIDLPDIARFAMGRYWRLADDGERAEFVRLFRELAVQTSNAGLAEYKSEKLRVAEARPADDEEILVRSAFSLQDGPSVQIDWRLRRDRERFKIQDVIVEGISIRIALRDMFATAIHDRGGTVAALLAAMRDLVRPRTQDAP
jgi:phospholipid transport system substrate-binding protein